jgi:acetolactate synthase-1/2/3 large subunit
MHGEVRVNRAIQHADVIVGIGLRFDDRVTGNTAGFAPRARIVHIDLDRAEIGKNVPVALGIVGDARDVTRRLAALVQPRTCARWLDEIREFTRPRAAAFRGDLAPETILASLYQATEGRCSIVTDVGQHQMWVAKLYPYREPNSHITSGGLGTMGFAVPAALGAKAGRPDKQVVAIDGDGCFQMTCQELATSTTEKIPFITAIINNAYLGMVRQWQELFYKERYSQVYLSYDTPDYVKLAEAYGAVGLRAEHPDEVDLVIEKALSIEDRSVVIDFRVDAGEMCFPMVPAGASNDDIIVGPEGLRPAEDPAEAPIA